MLLPASLALVAHLSLADVALEPPGLRQPLAAVSGAQRTPLPAAPKPAAVQSAREPHGPWARVSTELLLGTGAEAAMLLGALAFWSVGTGCRDWGCDHPDRTAPEAAAVSLVVGTNLVVPAVVWLVARSGDGVDSSIWAAFAGHLAGELAFFGAVAATNPHDLEAPILLGATLPALGATLGAELTRSRR